MSATNRNIDRKLKIASKTEVLAEARSFVGQAAREFGFDDADAMNIEIAVDEACTNIIKHAYKNDPEGWIHIRISQHRENGNPRIVIQITDSGKPFDSNSYTAPNMPEYLQKMKRGGLGVLLMKKIMDEVEYFSSSDDNNSIRLVKYLPPAS